MPKWMPGLSMGIIILGFMLIMWEPMFSLAFKNSGTQ